MDLRKQSFGQKDGIVSKMLLILGAIIVVAVGWYVLKTSDIGSGIDKNGYQLVNLSSGERFIGKLSGLSGDYVLLSDVYYPQGSGEDGGESAQNDLVVAKLSSSVAKPEDEMRIASDKIVHWENLQADSKIVQAIEQDGDK